MKAVAVFPETREARVIDHPEPAVESRTQVKLKMLDVGICGTDKEIVSFEYGTPPDGSKYLIIGHESLGQVVEAGADVQGIGVGDLIVPTVRRPCGHAECPACANGRQDFCYTGDFTERGIKQRHGYMSEFVVEEAAYLNVVPAGLRDVAVLVEPLTIAEKGLSQFWEVQQQRLPWMPQGKSGAGMQAVVLGAGPVGILGAMALRAEGFEVWVYSRLTPGDTRQQLIEATGAHFVDADQVPVEEMVNEQAKKLDLVYEATGASKLAFDFLSALGPNGLFLFTGVPGRKAPIAIDTDRLMRDMVLKNQIVLGTVNAPKMSFGAAIRHLQLFMEKWPAQVQAIISRRFPIDQALDPLMGKPGGIKNVIAIS